MHFELANPAAELDMLLVGELLAGNHQHQMLTPRVHDAPDIRVGNGTREVDTADLCTEGRGDTMDLERHVRLPDDRTFRAIPRSLSPEIRALQYSSRHTARTDHVR